MATKLATHKKIGYIGYIAGAMAIANFAHQQMPWLRGDHYDFDHGANLANGAIALVAAVAVLTSKALEELEDTIRSKTVDPAVNAAD